MLILNPDTYSLIAKRLLFSIPPEIAQSLTSFALKQEPIWRGLSSVFRVQDPRLEVNLSGMKLENPVGLAAGYDKNCEFLPSLAALGFGYVSGGTVTLLPQPGNPSPRIIRYTQDESLINSLGFPNHGLEFAARQLEQNYGARGNTPVVVSVSGITPDEIVACHRRMEPLVDAIEINISSPNTLGLRVFQEPIALADLLGKVSDGRTKPLFVKLPPYPSDEISSSSSNNAKEQVLSLARVCVEQGVEALTVSNTWPAMDSRLAVGAGGISGKVIFHDTIRMVADVKAEVGDRAAINACGGIFSGEDAMTALLAGATTVQILTGLIYRGPGIVKRINEELLALLFSQDASPAAA
ncbi:MAG: dihydroorotate dehydrogenase (quinone) [Chloroflexi bacterium]|nr:dihydroorotate dehydrogenase (quinone) [Chloroflexota bacterium]